MKISNNPGIATIQSATSSDLFLKACNEAIS
jgi:hypothetical protein